MNKLEQFRDRAEALLGRFETLLPPARRCRLECRDGFPLAPGAVTYRPCRPSRRSGSTDLYDIDRQKAMIEQNTR